MTRSARVFTLLLALRLLCACTAEPTPVPDVPELLPQEGQPTAPTLPARQTSTGTLRERSEDDVLTILEALTSTDFAGREAVVVGAHFDGSGFYGDALYPSAYDNASGTATLLTAAALLADVQLDADLIFVGFNGEESVLDGSAALVEPLCAAYESLALINIDCIGLKSESGCMLDGNAAAFSGLGERFSDAFVLCLTDNMNSDHKSFLGRKNVYATNLPDAGETNYSQSLMHTRLDTVDGLDPARILRAAQILAQYLFAGEYPSRLSG